MPRPETIPFDTAPPGQELPARQEQLAALVATGMTLAAAARKAKVGAATAKRWNAAVTFRERVRTIRGQMTARVVGRLVDAAAEAVDTLRALLSDEAHVRLKAADLILAHSLKHTELVELEERLASLEAGKTRGRATA